MRLVGLKAQAQERLEAVKSTLSKIEKGELMDWSADSIISLSMNQINYVRKGISDTEDFQSTPQYSIVQIKKIEQLQMFSRMVICVTSQVTSTRSLV